MQQVISEKQAREITGGRKPLVPVKYEEALKALKECETLDEAKYWDNKADALAAWAKIYRDDEAGRGAKRLKLHAYRRMYQLAIELRPPKNPSKPMSGSGVEIRGPGGYRIVGKTPGAFGLLMDKGLSFTQAQAASRLGRSSPEEFRKSIESENPPSPCTAARKNHCSLWARFSDQSRISTFYGFSIKNDPAAIAGEIEEDRVSSALEIVRKARDWLDELDQRLTARIK